MARGISNGPNSRPLDESLAETGRGIPDEAVADRELRPEDVQEPEIEGRTEALRRSGWARRGVEKK
jgi:hypothetical protein